MVVLPPWQHTIETRLVEVAVELQAAALGWLATSEAVMLNDVGEVNAPLQVTSSWPLVVEPEPAGWRQHWVIRARTCMPNTTEWQHAAQQYSRETVHRGSETEGASCSPAMLGVTVYEMRAVMFALLDVHTRAGVPMRVRVTAGCGVTTTAAEALGVVVGVRPQALMGVLVAMRSIVLVRCELRGLVGRQLTDTSASFWGPLRGAAWQLSARNHQLVVAFSKLYTDWLRASDPQSVANYLVGYRTGHPVLHQTWWLLQSWPSA